MVALLILSIGMLGIAGLFVESVRSTRSALLRTQAVNLVSDMSDRIRANATARAAYDLGSYGAPPGALDCAPEAANPGANCTVAQLAQDDLARWVAAVRVALPATDEGPPDAQVEHFPAAAVGAPERYRISVSWSEPGEDAPFSYQNDVIIMPRGPAT
jgi:type IV pilus assembly protein PilV